MSSIRVTGVNLIIRDLRKSAKSRLTRKCSVRATEAWIASLERHERELSEEASCSDLFFKSYSTLNSVSLLIIYDSLITFNTNISFIIIRFSGNKKMSTGNYSSCCE